jgi:hypothetical protein
MNGNPTPDPTTVALTGILPFILVLGAVLALVTSLLLLRLYRRAVLRSMNLAAGAHGAPAVPATAPASPAAPLTVNMAESATGVATDDGTLRKSLSGPIRSAFVYAAAGAVFAGIMTAAWLAATRDPAFGPVKLLFLFWSYFWPAALSANLVAGTSRAQRRRVIIGYFAVFVLLTVIALVRNPDMRWHELPLYWLITNGPPTVLLYGFLARRIRAVGPLVLTFMIAALAGSQIAVALLGASEASMRAAVDAGALIGLGGGGTFWGTHLVGFSIFGVVGWLLLRWLGHRYREKRLSDGSLTLDALWLLFAIVQSVSLAFEGAAWVASGLVAFLGYKLAARAGYAWMNRAREESAPRTLLLLRVFALGQRSEQLFDALRMHWLRIGNICLIAGPDLATSTVEPHEFLGFVSGRLSRQFVMDAADLARRVATMDRKQDPDGRYRANEFFCHADTWQQTMRALVGESDAVLMDLRGFSPSNQGCLYELGQLLDAIDLTRVVFTIDATTDRTFLEQALQRLWAGLSADSPNRRAGAPVARLMPVAQITLPSIKNLLAQLAGSPLAAR